VSWVLIWFYRIIYQLCCRNRFQTLTSLRWVRISLDPTETIHMCHIQRILCESSFLIHVNPIDFDTSTKEGEIIYVYTECCHNPLLLGYKKWIAAREIWVRCSSENVLKIGVLLEIIHVLVDDVSVGDGVAMHKITIIWSIARSGNLRRPFMVSISRANTSESARLTRSAIWAGLPWRLPHTKVRRRFRCPLRHAGSMGHHTRGYQLYILEDLYHE